MRRADAFLANHVANRASRTQGRAFLATAARVFSRARRSRCSPRPRGLRLHLAPVWGAALSALDIPLADAQRVFLWSTARGVLSAAVRLGLAGTHEAQALLAASARCSTRRTSAAARSAWMRWRRRRRSCDLLQGTHDRLYSRLFQS